MAAAAGRTLELGESPGEQVGIFCKQDLAVTDPNGQGKQAFSRARTCDAITRTYRKQRAMRGALDQRIIHVQKAIGLPVKRMTRMGTTVHVRISLIALAHDEATQWPVPGTYPEGARSRIGQLIQPADREFTSVTH